MLSSKLVWKKSHSSVCRTDPWDVVVIETWWMLWGSFYQVAKVSSRGTELWTMMGSCFTNSWVYSSVWGNSLLRDSSSPFLWKMTRYVCCPSISSFLIYGFWYCLVECYSCICQYMPDIKPLQALKKKKRCLLLSQSIDERWLCFSCWKY